MKLYKYISFICEMNYFKVCFYLFVFLVRSIDLNAQEAFIVSESIQIKVKKKSTNIPDIQIQDVGFSDMNSNRKIDADEKAIIQFKLKNTGTGKGQGISLNVTESSGLSGLNYNKQINIGDLDTGKSVLISIDITGDVDLKSGDATFLIKVNESNGFGNDPYPIEIKTQAFRGPDLKIVDYSVSSQNSTVIEKKKPFDIQALVQNLGQGFAKNVVVKLKLPQNTFCISTNEVEKIGDLIPGEKKMLNYTIVANNDFNADKLPFEFEIIEKYGKYGTNSMYTLAMNQSVPKEKIKIQAIENPEVPISVASLVSDVDKNIPFTDKVVQNRVALIIGNEDYSPSVNAQINVPYAYRDAQVFREYVQNVLGVEPSNIFFFSNATAGIMRREIDRVSKLVNKLGPQAELIFYYAGHGFPDEKTKIPYLIPVDVNASNLFDAVSLKDLYTNFGSIGASKVTIFLDACFSGGGREEGILASRGIRIVPDMQQAKGNMVIFAASMGDQVALPYHDKKHGLFTYFLLKKLKDSKGKVSYKEMYDYLKTSVGVESIRIAKEQDPVVSFSPKILNQWEKWTF